MLIHIHPPFITHPLIHPFIHMPTHTPTDPPLIRSSTGPLTHHPSISSPMSIHPSILYSSICSSIHLFTPPATYPPLTLTHPSSISLPTHPMTHPYIHHPSIHHLSFIYLPTYPSIYQPSFHSSIPLLSIWSFSYLFISQIFMVSATKTKEVPYFISFNVPHVLVIVSWFCMFEYAYLCFHEYPCCLCACDFTICEMEPFY